MAYDILSIDRDEAEEVMAEILPLGAVLLSGPPGTGKSFMAGRVCDNRIKLPFYPIHSHMDTMQGEVMLGYGPVEGADGKWAPLPGPVLMAMGYKLNPKTLQIEDCEPGCAWFEDLHEMGSGGLSALYAAWDSAKSGGKIMLPSGKVVTPKPGYCSGGTTNRLVTDLPEPVQDRLLAVIPVMQPSEEMVSVLNPYMQALCLLDYNGQNLNPVGTYRQYQSMSLLMSKLPVFKAAALAFRGDRQKIIAVLSSLKGAEYPGAAEALTQVMQSMPSGAPR